MEKRMEVIAGDTAGIDYSFPVYRFEGRHPDAPSAYIQAALHGGEIPGVVAIHRLMPMLRQAESEGRLLGRLTVVPWANPIGRSQYLFDEQEGRFHLGTRTNFNRDFPLLAMRDAPIPEDPLSGADERLKARLLSLSLGHDIVLDLHCDDQSVPYLYVPKALWPWMADIAAVMSMEAVLLWDGGSGASFDDASINPYLEAAPQLAAFERRVVATVEYRGVADVDPKLAQTDAEGLYRALVARGVIEDRNLARVDAFHGLAAPIEHVEMIKAPRAGAVLYHVSPGDQVSEGALLATIVHTPGESDGTIDIHAPQSGFILTRRYRRILRAGEDVLKLVGDQPSATAKPGALEI